MAVPRAVAIGEELADDRMAAECRQSQGRDKLLSGWCDDHLYLSAFLDQTPNDVGCLVGCDTSRNAKYDVFAF